MKRINVFVRRQRIKKLENWTMNSILAEVFLLAIFPQVAAIAAVVGIIAWLLRLRIDKKFKIRSLPFDIPITIFVMLGAISVFMSPVRSFELVCNYCGVMGLFVITYILIGQNIRTPEQVKSLAKSLALSALIVVLYGYSQYIFGIDISEMKWIDGEAFPELRKRVFSTLESPNILAGYLDVIICIALGFFAKFGTNKQKLIILAVIFILMICLAMTYSQGAFFTIAIIFILYGIFYDWRILVLFVFCTGILIYSDTTFLESVLSDFNRSYDSLEGLRVGIWVTTVAMISDHPFIGIGWGAYEFIYPQYNYYLVDTTQTIYHAHNLYLQTAAEVGIIGVLAYCWYFFGTMIMALSLSTNETYIKIKNIFDSFKNNVSLNVEFTKNFAESKALLMSRLSDFINRILEKFSTSKKDENKTTSKKTETELVHHEEMKWNTKTKKPNDEKSDDDKIDIQKFAAESELFEDDDNKNISDKKIIESIQLGTGLAFLSMALNGIGDDLLFNISSSVLMWILGALAAAINLLDKENKI